MGSYGSSLQKFDIDSSSIEEPPYVAFAEANTRLTLEIDEGRARLLGKVAAAGDFEWGEAAGVLVGGPEFAALSKVEKEYSRLQT